jgi:DNA modification methylase
MTKKKPTNLFSIEERKPKDIIISNRSRIDKGKLENLTKAISTQGQLNPILITADNELIAGERRTLVCKKLRIPVLCRIMPKLSPEDKLLIEHMENDARKDFTWSEELMLRYKIHNYWIKKAEKTKESWTFKDSAKEFDCSIGGLSTDLTLAAMIIVFPDLTNCTSKGQAREASKKMAEQASAFKKMDSMSDDEKKKMAVLMSGGAIKKPAKKKPTPIVQAKHNDDIEELIEHDSAKNPLSTGGSNAERTVEELVTEQDNILREEIEEEKDLPSYVVEDLFTFVPKFPNESIGFIELDPLYAINYDENYQQKNEQVQTKADWTPEELLHFYETMFPIYYSKLMSNSWVLCWLGKEWVEDANEIAERAGFKTQPFGIWAKNGGSVNRPSTTMVSTFECFILLRKGNATFNIPSLRNVVNCPASSGSSKTHQWEKPIKLYDIFFEAMGRPKTVFHSSFAGSGNCLISAKKADMIPIGCDLSEKDATQFYYKYKKHFMEI